MLVVLILKLPVKVPTVNLACVATDNVSVSSVTIGGANATNLIR